MILANFFFKFSDIANFQAFFNYIDMRALLENFCVYHVNAPGQEENAPALPDEWVYFSRVNSPMEKMTGFSGSFISVCALPEFIFNLLFDKSAAQVSI